MSTLDSLNHAGEALEPIDHTWEGHFVPGRSHGSKIVGVHLSFLYSPQTSNYSGQRLRGRGERNGDDGVPQPQTILRRKLRATLCNFMHPGDGRYRDSVSSTPHSIWLHEWDTFFWNSVCSSWGMAPPDGPGCSMSTPRVSCTVGCQYIESPASIDA